MSADQESPEERLQRLHSIVEVAGGQYSLYSRLEDEGKSVLIDGISGFVVKTDELYRGSFNSMPHPDEVLAIINQPDAETGHRMVTALKSRLVEFPISTRIGSAKVLVDKGISHIFRDALTMHCNGLETLEALKALRSRRRSARAQEGRQHSTTSESPPSTQVVGLRGASPLYSPPKHR